MDMMEKAAQAYERDEVDLVQLLVWVLERVGSILLCALALGVLLFGWKLYGGLRALPDEETVRTAQEDYQTKLTAYQAEKKGYEDRILTASESLERNEAYAADSMLLHLDPLNHYQSTAVWLVEADERVAAQVFGAYAALAADGELAETVRGNVGEGVGGPYVGELILVETDKEASLLRLMVLGDSQETAERVFDAARSSLEENRARIASTVGEFRLTLIKEWSGHVSKLESDMQQVNTPATVLIRGEGGDKSFQTGAEKITAAQSAFNAQRSQTQSSLAELQKAAAALTPPTAPVFATRGDVLKTAIKYGVIGLLLGAVLAALWHTICFLMIDPVMSEGELRGRCGLFILASVRRYSGKTPWQRLLGRLSGDAGRTASAEDAAALARANAEAVLAAAGRQGEKILLVGGEAELALLSDPDGAGVFVTGGDVMTDGAVVERLRDYENVALVVRKGAVSCVEVARELEKLLLLRKNVIGTIAL